MFQCKVCRHIFDEPQLEVDPAMEPDTQEELVCPQCGDAEFRALPEESWGTQP